MTRDQIIRIAIDADFHLAEADCHYERLRQFAELIAIKEREACAEACATVRNQWVLSVDGRHAAQDCTNVIRARGEK